MLIVSPIKAFSDNYIWLLHREDDTRAWVVDPGDAAAVNRALEANGLTLEGILVTHHHFDHVGGLDALIQAHSPLIIGPCNPAIVQIGQRVVAGDSVTVLDRPFDVIEVPGHTLDHIAFFSPGDPPLLFCGDTLFAGGCGRIFEGTAPMMYESLQRLAALPEDTRVHCAHEYTLANLAFARAAEPDNQALQQRLVEAESLRRRDIPTVPSELHLELLTNPFLRSQQSGLVDSLASQGKLSSRDPVDVFAVTRDWKDNF